MTAIRTFIAVDLDDPMRDALAGLQERIRRELSPSMRWVRTEGMHLTLKFLGQAPEGLVPSIADALDAAARRSRPFAIELGEPGGFPDTRRPRVLWAAVRGDLDVLADLRQNVEEMVSPLGFPTEDRAFRPHLTLGRASGNVRIAPERWEAAALKAADVSQTVRHVALMKSDLGPGGARYTRLHAAALNSPSSPP